MAKNALSVVTDITYKGQTKFSQAYLRNVITMSQIGDVSFIDPHHKRQRTTIIKWNLAAPDYKITQSDDSDS
jgi:hypothetical protein